MIEVYGPNDPYPIELPTEPEHERIIEACWPDAGMAACWNWDETSPRPAYSPVRQNGSPRGCWRLRGKFGHVGTPPVPWGRAFWEWHEIVSVCVQQGWKLTIYPEGKAPA